MSNFISKESAKLLHTLIERDVLKPLGHKLNDLGALRDSLSRDLSREERSNPNSVWYRITNSQYVRVCDEFAKTYEAQHALSRFLDELNQGCKPYLAHTASLKILHETHRKLKPKPTSKSKQVSWRDDMTDTH